MILNKQLQKKRIAASAIPMISDSFIFPFFKPTVLSPCFFTAKNKSTTPTKQELIIMPDTVLSKGIRNFKYFSDFFHINSKFTPLTTISLSDFQPKNSNEWNEITKNIQHKRQEFYFLPLFCLLSVLQNPYLL